MSPGEQLIRNAKEIRQRLRFPPNAVIDTGINLTRKSTAYKGDIPPPDTPPKRPLVIQLAPPKPPEPAFHIPISMNEIVEAVCDYYGPSPASIRGPNRMAILCHARRIIVYLAVKLLGKSLSSIGRNLNKDHTSILHAKRKIDAHLLKNPELMSEINKIEEALVDSHRSSVPAFR